MSYNDEYHDDYNDDQGDGRQPAGYQDIVSNGIPNIRVIGVGGAGNNAVNRMIEANIKSAEYIAVNTDAQVLLRSKAPVKIQIGVKRTRGLGAGADPEVGREAAEESKDQLARAIDGTDLLFITAGMGGGTGTGAAPVIAKIARDKHILTVAVITCPFEFEGRRKMENAMKGIENLKKFVDTLVIIPNEKIRKVVDRSVPFDKAFAVADDVLRQGIRGIADLIVTPGLINCDFADVRTVIENKGLAHMGVGVAKGENRIIEAVKLAVNNPLTETTIEHAKGIVVNVVGGPDLTLDEVGTAMVLIHGVVDYNAIIILGACIDQNIQDEVEVTVIATGFPEAESPRAEARTAQPRAAAPAPRRVDPSEAQSLLYGEPRTQNEPRGAAPGYPPYTAAPSAPPSPAPQPRTGYAPAPEPQPRTGYAPAPAPQPRTGYAPGTDPYGVPPYAQPAPAPSERPQGGDPSDPRPSGSAEEEREESHLPLFARRLRGKK